MLSEMKTSRLGRNSDLTTSKIGGSGETIDEVKPGNTAQKGSFGIVCLALPPEAPVAAAAEALEDWLLVCGSLRRCRPEPIFAEGNSIPRTN